MIPPTKDWKTTNFMINFVDADNAGVTGIDHRYDHVGH